MIYRIKAGTECTVTSGIGEHQHTYYFSPRNDRLFETKDLIGESKDWFLFKDSWGYDTFQVPKSGVIKEPI